VVNDASSENGPGRIERNCSGFKNMSLVIPPRTRKGYGVFHTKLWLIKFPSFLRVVIGTGNQHAEDWLIWLNSYWYQDFYLKGIKLSDYE
jgi:tyrosyl-DNA phosphodiesterase-1